MTDQISSKELSTLLRAIVARHDSAEFPGDFYLIPEEYEALKAAAERLAHEPSQVRRHCTLHNAPCGYGGYCKDCPEMRAAQPPADEYEAIGHQFKFPSPWGGFVWCDDHRPRNGSSYVDSRVIYAKRHSETKSGDT